MALRSILIVDDEPDVRAVVRRLLRTGRIAADIAEAGSADDAMRLGRKQPFHLVISDERMPGMAGVELLAWFRGAQPEAGRILLTGYADLDVVGAAVNDGRVDAFLEKPFDEQPFLATVARVLDECAAKAERRAAFQRALRSLGASEREVRA